MAGKRNFSDWLTAYVEYSNNKFAPVLFHQWSGISTIAGALGRKVWLPWDDTFSYFPNLFIFLVAHPGVGKSSALNKSTRFLQDLNKSRNGKVTFIPSQVTEAKFIDLMSRSDSYSVAMPSGGTAISYQSAGYYFASEASNSLKNLYGDFIACMTDFYDCPRFWQKATIKDGDPITLNNVCFNLIAGCTFDYLGKIITQDNIMGGFASRVTYVIFKQKLTEAQINEKAIFQAQSEVITPERLEFRNKLLDDLAQIHAMVGPYSGTEDFGKLYSSWYPSYEKARQDNPSEKMQSLLVRKPTTLFKLCMLLSASESNDRVLHARHWERALAMTEEVEKDLPEMLRESRASQTKTQDGITQSILGYFVNNKNPTKAGLTSFMTLRGFEPRAVSSTLESLISGNVIAVSGGNQLTLKVNPNDHL